MKTMYRKRNKKAGKSIRTTLCLSPNTIKGLNRIRTAWRRKYPLAAYPSLSAALEQVIEKHLRLFDSRPTELAKEVALFEKKYPQDTKPAVIPHE